MTRQRKDKFYNFTIPCKPYIAQYVAACYGSPFIADKRTSLGYFISIALSKKQYKYDTLPARRPDYYCATLSIRLTLWQYLNLGSDIAPDIIVAINTYVEDVFTEHLYWWCHIHTQNGTRYKGYEAAVRSFAAQHGIVLDDHSVNPHITFDALKRKELRERRKREKNTSLKKTS